MKNATWAVAASILCLSGCLYLETREEEGFVQLSGREVDVNGAIRQLIEDRGWQGRGERTEMASSSSWRMGLGVSTQEGLILPSRSSEAHSTSWLTATTQDGKSVEFEIQKATDNPTTIYVHVEEGPSASTAEVTTDLSRRLRGEIPSGR